MSDIVNDLTPAVLAEAIEVNQVEAFAALVDGPQYEIYKGPDMMRFAGDIPIPMLNGVLRARFKPDDMDARIDATLEYFKARNLPHLWWVGPGSQPADLGKHLQSHGLIRGNDTPGMAVDLTKLNENLPKPAGLKVERVNDKEAVEHWSRIIGVGFELPDSAVRLFVDACVNLGFDRAGLYHHYVGWLDGTPVATSSMFLLAGVAGIYNVATLPEARGRGVGAAVTLAPLQEARARGYRVGILQSSEMGFPVYQRLGFEEYCRFGMYVWTGESAHE